MADFFSRVQSGRQVVRANAGAIRKRAKWVSRGARFLRGRGVSRGGDLDWVLPDPTFQRRALQLIEQAAPTVARAFNRRLVPVAERALSAWPVQTGLSRASLSLTFVVEGDNLIGSLDNSAPYAGFINQFDTAQQLIILPGELAALKMAEDIAKELG